MKDICLLSCGRWSAIIREAEPGMFASPDNHLHITVSCDGERFSQYGLCSALEALHEKPRDEDREREAFIGYADLLGISVSSGDMKNAHFLFRAGDKLCFHILSGGSVKAWCEELRLKPVTEWKAPQDRRRPCSLVITGLDESFILSRKAFFEPKSRAEKRRDRVCP